MIRAEGYNPSWDVQFEKGDLGEALAVLGLTSAEVKTQKRAVDYGSVFVETETRRPPGRWRPDGLDHPRKTAPWWIFVVDDDTFIGKRASALKQIVERVLDVRGPSKAPRSEVEGRGAVVKLVELLGLEPVRPRRRAA